MCANYFNKNMTEVTKAEKAELAVIAKAEKAEAKASAKEVSRVTITFKNGSTREFCEELHGENFVATADEFCASNKEKVESREDK